MSSNASTESSKVTPPFQVPESPDERRTLLRANVQQLVDSGIANLALSVGDHAPSFVLPNAVGKMVSSEELLRRGPLVINFYRGAWCSHCNRELHALQGSLPQINALGAELIAISPNLPDNSLTTIEKNNLTYEVLTDLQNRVVRQFNLVFRLYDEVEAIYKFTGNDLATYNGDGSWELPIPATYVVAPGGKIVYAFVNADHAIRVEPAEVIAALAAL